MTSHKQRTELASHRARGAPDSVRSAVEEPHAEGVAVAGEVDVAPGGVCGEGVEGEEEGFFHFDGAWDEHGWRGEHANEGADGEARAGDEIVELADDGDLRRGDAELFVRFA